MRRPGLDLAGWLCLVVGVLLPALPHAAHATGFSPVERRQLLESGIVGSEVVETLDSQETVRVIIAFSVPAAQGAHGGAAFLTSAVQAEIDSIGRRITEEFASGEFDLQRRYRSVNALAGYVNAMGLLRLLGNPNIVRIDVDAPGAGHLAQSVPLVNLDVLYGLGLTGAGVTAAVLDSGVDTDHPDLSDDLVAERCFCDDSGAGCCPNGSTTQSGAESAEDDNGHGTNVAGIITSGGTIAPRGGAPDVEIVAIKVLDSGGYFCCSSDIVAALDWIINNRPDVDIVNMSLGTFDLFTGDCDNATSDTIAFATAINTLRANGVLSFASSGNDGSGTHMPAPACVANAISVGAVWDANVGAQTILGCTDDTTAADQVTCFSNSNSTTDVFAPGAPTTSTGLSGGSSTYYGTSQASPLAAACAALLLEDSPSSTPASIEAALKSSSTLAIDSTNGLTFPRLDCQQARAAMCGDGALGSSEECDPPGPCCSVACQAVPDGLPCDDGQFCNGADTCTSGSCISAGDPCSGGQECADSCNEAADNCYDPADSPCGDPSDTECTDPDTCDETGSCQPNDVQYGTDCADEDICNGNETCQEGTCTPGTPLVCDDTNPCTDDSCNPSSGCLFTNNSASCDDGAFCNGADTCSAGACSGHSGDPCDGADGDGDCAESCDDAADNCTAPDSDGSVCDDGLYCSLGDACTGGICVPGASTPCPGPDGDGECSESCNEATDNCTLADPNGAACSDGVFCNGAETCSGGICTDSTGDPCPGPDDDPDCSESCDEGTASCTGADANGSMCDDGLFCTVTDTCDAGICTGVGDPCPGPDGDGDCSESCVEVWGCTGPDPNPAGPECSNDLFCRHAETCMWIAARDEIQKLDQTTGATLAAATIPDAGCSDPFGIWITDVAVDSSGNRFILAQCGNDLDVIFRNEVVLGSSLTGEYYALAVDLDGSLLVGVGQSIVRLNPNTGELISTLELQDPGCDPFVFVQDIAVDSLGNRFMAAYCHSNSDLVFRNEMPLGSPLPLSLETIALEADGSLLVGGIGPSILRLDPNTGATLATLTLQDPGGCEFPFIQDIAVGSSGDRFAVVECDVSYWIFLFRNEVLLDSHGPNDTMTIATPSVFSVEVPSAATCARLILAIMVAVGAYSTLRGRG